MPSYTPVNSKLTASLHLKMDGWNMLEDDPFLLGWPFSSGSILGSVHTCKTKISWLENPLSCIWTMLVGCVGRRWDKCEICSYERNKKDLEMRCWVCTACFSNALHDHWGIHNCDTHNAALASLNLAEWKKDKNRTFCRVYLPTFPHPKNLSQIEMLVNFGPCTN